MSYLSSPQRRIILEGDEELRKRERDAQDPAAFMSSLYTRARSTQTHDPTWSLELNLILRVLRVDQTAEYYRHWGPNRSPEPHPTYALVEQFPDINQLRVLGDLHQTMAMTYSMRWRVTIPVAPDSDHYRRQVDLEITFASDQVIRVPTSVPNVFTERPGNLINVWVARHDPKIDFGTYLFNLHRAGLF